MRIKLVTVLGLLCLFGGIAANEWVLTFLFSHSGSPEPIDLIKIRIFDATLIVFGTILLVQRERLAQDRPLALFRRDYPRSCAIAFGIALIMITLMLLELCLHGIKRSGPSSVILSITSTTLDGSPDTQNWVMPDDVLGYKPRPNRHVRYRIENEGRVAEVTYDFDEYGRRMTPVDSSDRRSRFMLFFGCSFTFGELVQSNETLPYHVAELATAYTPYNYGFRGYGPQQMVEQLRAADMPKQVSETDGIGIYTAIDLHVRRAIGSMRITDGVRAQFPYYTLEADDRLVSRGSFARGRPSVQLAYNTLAKSQLLRHFNVDLPPKVRNDHLELTARIIDEARAQFKSNFASDEFYVLIYPGSTELLGILPILQRRQIRYLDYSTLFDSKAPRYQIEGDGHPTAEAYDLLGRQVVHDLQLSEGRAADQRTKANRRRTARVDSGV